MASGGDLITVFLLVEDGKNPPLTKLQIEAPLNSNLYQVMILGEKEHPDKFSFEAVWYEQYQEHMITCINGVCNEDPFYWMVYDATTGEPLPKGVDETYPQNDSSYLWKYENTSKQKVGKAEQSTARQRLKDAIVVTFSAVNDRDPSWPAVHKLPAIAEAGSALGEVMKKAQEQHPKKFRFTTDVDSAHGTYVKSINDLQNDEPYNWLVFDAHTSKLLPTGLDDTFPKNKDSYPWRYSDKTHPPSGTGTEGQK